MLIRTPVGASDFDLASGLTYRVVQWEGGASLWVNGIDPGFANDWLPLTITSISERIEQVRCMEILNYAT